MRGETESYTLRHSTSQAHMAGQKSWEVMPFSLGSEHLHSSEKSLPWGWWYREAT